MVHRILKTSAIITLCSIAVLLGVQNVRAEEMTRQEFRQERQELRETQRETRQELKAERKEERTEQIQDRCQLSQERLSQMKTRFAENSVRHQQNAERIRTQLQKTATALEAKGYDVSQLRSDAQVLEGKLSTIKTQVAAVVAQLEIADDYVCGESEGQYKTEMQKARELAKPVQATAKDIRTFMNETVRPHIKALRSQKITAEQE